MPLYEYQCESHGVFDEFAPGSASNEPAACPVCEQASARILSIPRFKQMSGGVMKAHERNEKSRHEPHVCSSGCSHNHKKPTTKDGEPAKPKLQPYTGPRPWVIEHA